MARKTRSRKRRGFFSSIANTIQQGARHSALRTKEVLSNISYTDMAILAASAVATAGAGSYVASYGSERGRQAAHGRAIVEIRNDTNEGNANRGRRAA